MNGLILYMIKSSIYMTVFLSLYMLVMRKTTFFRLNRITFMTGTILCLILPLIKIEMPAESISITPVSFIEEALAAEPETLKAAVIGTETEWKTMLISIIYAVGCLVSVIAAAVSYIRMSRMIRSARPERIGDTTVRIVEGEIPSFSWGRHIVLSKNDIIENPAILIHEKMHVKCRHSIDLMIYTVATVFQWFNPLVWIAYILLCKDIEMACDEQVLRKNAKYRSPMRSALRIPSALWWKHSEQAKFPKREFPSWLKNTSTFARRRSSKDSTSEDRFIRIHPPMAISAGRISNSPGRIQSLRKA